MARAGEVRAIAYYAGFVVLALTVLAAFWRGGRLEKQLAAVVAVAWLASAVVPNDQSSLSWPLFAIDVGLVIYLLYHAVFSRRRWPMAAAGFQMLIVATHIAFLLRPHLEQWGYFTAYYLWSWGVLAAILVGSLRTPKGSAT